MVGPSDTTAEAARIQLDLLRRMSPARRLAIAADLSAAVRALARLDVEARHSGAGARERRRRWAERLFGADLARRVYG